MRILVVKMAIAVGMTGQLVRGEGVDEVKQIEGKWLVQRAEMNGRSVVSRAWTSVLTIHGDGFLLSHFDGVSASLRGRLSVDVGGKKGAVDLAVEGIDLSENWEGVKYPACLLKGICEVDGGELRLCVRTGPRLERSGEFRSEDEGTLMVTFVRAREGFVDFPKDVMVKVVDAEGKGVAGASVFLHAVYADGKSGALGEWKYFPLKANVTGADGMAGVALSYEDLGRLAAGARDAEGKRVGYTAVSPGSAQGGSVTVVLYPACHVMGRIECAELTKVGKPLGWTNVMVYTEGMNAIDFRSSERKDFSFDVPPGEYLLHIYGSDLHGKEVAIKVGATDREVRVPTVGLEASQLVLLKGELAPELEGVVDWRGGAVKLADLRGKYVLLDFWGYWCGPCVAAMPTMMALDEKFRSKGLAVIGVHYDSLGEVDTAAKLEGKMAGLRKFWDGKDIKFPVGVLGGKKGGADEQYGIDSFPTTVLIDREGKVVGRFSAVDEKDAMGQVEALLGK